MKSFANSFSDLLTLNELGVLGDNIFIDNMPRDSKSTAPMIIVYNTPSYSISGRARESANFTCQVRVRASKSSEAYELITSIYKLIYDIEFKDSDGKAFYVKQPRPPQFLTFDENSRANWVLNITALSRS